MRNEFKTMGTRVKIPDVIDYIKEHVSSEADAQWNIYVGCDSQNHTRQTVYAVAVVIHHVGHGAHVIYRREGMKRIRDDITRLWAEAEMAVKTAKFLIAPDEDEDSEKGILPVVNDVVIDFDFNFKKHFKSNILYDAAVGLATANGYSSRCKPVAFAATYAANKLCR